ncbi:Holliday junction DNA helicase RuvA [candidate division WOR-1 bacterium RIFCSPHIGHO2_01_FULL_53_15]|uniref:Holliday junction branch migration complex subunit RuvA n=1 Tax=candidate division WOR-1 bacterium RIFCSPHIGHO2_01_FULL_53_15 TaxID=1802564 RepID=A0A1F4Q1A9_UNCSA|nr:MAG: Holliday junction DNA helicase RuvA [candidate division WOR-1 bacterium RIFCSPHIGHO2_01_FULL_53_15]OGC13894.1 MAG: Holliday junction DNA helicase RuvA [candidate division WOR-1 bacterium RIFCSPHIGHO2_02_FULL_53_26]
MISHLAGTLEHVDRQSVVLDVGSIGYQIKVPASVLNRLPALGEKVKLFTIQVVREDDISLYGFLNKEERSLFSLFLSVSGVGPKTAMTILSGFPLDRLVGAVAQGDITLLSSISGVGKKTAERIVVELKEKIARTYALKPSEMAEGIAGSRTTISDSISALIALGYSPRDARDAIMKLKIEDERPVEEIIKEALRVLV